MRSTKVSVKRMFDQTIDRRKFLSLMGAASAGLLINSHGHYAHATANTRLSKVAMATAETYDRKIIRQKVEQMFEAIDGLRDIMTPGDKVALKINLTGGSPVVYHPGLQGVSPLDSIWTHPEVIRAVGGLLIDFGIRPQNLYIVEALWDQASYYDFGYAEVQTDLGTKFIDLNTPDPYPEFIHKAVGDQSFYYEKFLFNPILDEVDVFVSIAKMKQHWSAGVTHSMKNLVGLVPKQPYTLDSEPSFRSALHFEGGHIGFHLPRTICDLNSARPIQLSVIDGVLNVEGAEGPWFPTIAFSAYHSLLAGKDPVAIDAVASQKMGNDPEAEKLQLPGGGTCDNYLALAHQLGMGTNQRAEIEIVHI